MTGSGFSQVTIRLDADYRYYGATDGRDVTSDWCLGGPGDDPSKDDAQVKESFNTLTRVMGEISAISNKQADEGVAIEILIEEMARCVFASNERVDGGAGLGLNETSRLCMALFRGEIIEYSDRTDEYQRRIDKYIIAGNEKSSTKSFVLDHFVRDDKPLNQELIKDVHRIMMFGLDTDDSGGNATKSLAGVYRSGDTFTGGSHKFPRPGLLQKEMQAFVTSLKTDIDKAEQAGQLDPCVPGAKYCARFVQIHPFKDGNGRMCRLILNAILIKYAGIVISVGEKGEDRQKYIDITVESRKTGGHHGQLAKMVLEQAVRTSQR